MMCCRPRTSTQTDCQKLAFTLWGIQSTVNRQQPCTEQQRIIKIQDLKYAQSSYTANQLKKTTCKSEIIMSDLNYFCMLLVFIPSVINLLCFNLRDIHLQFPLFHLCTSIQILPKAMVQLLYFLSPLCVLNRFSEKRIHKHIGLLLILGPQQSCE